MQPDRLVALVDRQAETYDTRWEGMAPVRDTVHLLVEAGFAHLPTDAHLFCVGVGTGAEIAHFAGRHPEWRFTALDPSGEMLDRCRDRAERDGFASRCTFHQGYVDDLPAESAFDAATCFLVSQFILDRDERSAFFRSIADRLHSGGLLASSDLASDEGAYELLLPTWLAVMTGTGVSEEAIASARTAYATDVAVLPPTVVASIIASGGFEPPVQIVQAGLMHAWLARRRAGRG